MEIIRNYKNHTIKISDESMIFEVSGPLVSLTFSSFLDATSRIDDATKKDEAQTRRNIAIVCLNPEGEEITVRGIHAGHGGILGGDDIYPNVEWVRIELKRISVLRAELNHRQAVVQKLCISKYSGNLASRRASHEEQVSALVAVIEAKTRLANEMKKE